MSNQYIKQVNNQNFVYPNFELAEYDVNIIHNINNNSVSGTVTSFNATTISSTGITLSYSASWSLNGAEPFILKVPNQTSAWSIHAMGSGQTYFKPWRLVSNTQITNGLTTYTINSSFTITPSQMGLTTFVSGTYYFEFRFIGSNAIFPVNISRTITVP